MTRSEMGITPARHATLGLDRYCQVTSPIRRYTDLMGHFQLKAHLRGAELPFTPTEMPEIIASVANAAYEAMMVERQTKKYWAMNTFSVRTTLTQASHGKSLWSAGLENTTG